MLYLEGFDGAQVREVGDGNINFVYIVEGPAGGLVVKQGLPYIRIAHDWALTQARRDSWLLLGKEASQSSFGLLSSICDSTWPGRNI